MLNSSYNRSLVVQLPCVACNHIVPVSDKSGADQVWMTCESCNDQDGILDVQYDMEAVAAAWQTRPLKSRPKNQWRYEELLPLSPDAIPHHWQVGWTPIIDAQRLATELGLKQLLFKDDGRNPSASFKDRASSVGVAHALQVGARTIACASTGNAATSLACHAALAGLPAKIFVPQTAPEPKLAQLLVYGATVYSVEASYDEAYQLCSTACKEFGWYNRNCAINPVLVEGKKTAGLEIAEQSNEFGGMPDWIAVSVGDGCTIAGIWKGMQEMHDLGIIDRLPRLLAVQAAEVSPIKSALDTGELPPPGTGSTMADSIDVQVPRNWRKAVRAIRESAGLVVTVSDEQISTAMKLAGRHGVFAEPAAAAALAGTMAAIDGQQISGGDRVLAMITGSGLKDIRSAIQVGGKPIRIKPSIEELATREEP